MRKSLARGLGAIAIVGATMLQVASPASAGTTYTSHKDINGIRVNVSLYGNSGYIKGEMAASRLTAGVKVQAVVHCMDGIHYVDSGWRYQHAKRELARVGYGCTYKFTNFWMKPKPGARAVFVARIYG